MSRENIYSLIMNWCIEFICHEFSREDMEDNVSLVGFDSLSAVELCEYLENQLGVEVDYEWIWDCESLSELSCTLESRLLAA